jgi:hypothetical protein
MTWGLLEHGSDPLPKILLAELGALEALQQFLELGGPAQGHLKRGAGGADGRHEVVVLAGRDVVQALVRALDEPGKPKKKINHL